MNRQRDVLNRHPGGLGQHPRALLGASCLLVAGCSLQDLDYLGYNYGRDGGLGSGLNTSGAGGSAGRGGSGSSNAGNGGTPGGTGGVSGGGAGGDAGDGGSAGTGGNGAGNGGAGGSAGTAAINYGGSAGYLLEPGDGGPDGNLIDDPGFESGIASWIPQGSPTLTWTSVGPAAGARCLRASGRSQAYFGPLYSLKDDIIPGETYSVSAYVRVSHTNVVKLSTKQTCSGETEAFSTIVETEATTSWRLFEGTFVAPTCTLTQFGIFAEHAPQNVDIYLDEVRVALLP